MVFSIADIIFYTVLIIVCVLGCVAFVSWALDRMLKAHRIEVLEDVYYKEQGDSKTEETVEVKEIGTKDFIKAEVDEPKVKKIIAKQISTEQVSNEARPIKIEIEADGVPGDTFDIHIEVKVNKPNSSNGSVSLY